MGRFLTPVVIMHRCSFFRSWMLWYLWCDGKSNCDHRCWLSLSTSQPDKSPEHSTRIWSIPSNQRTWPYFVDIQSTCRDFWFLPLTLMLSMKQGSDIRSSSFSSFLWLIYFFKYFCENIWQIWRHVTTSDSIAVWWGWWLAGPAERRMTPPSHPMGVWLKWSPQLSGEGDWELHFYFAGGFWSRLLPDDCMLCVDWCVLQNWKLRMNLHNYPLVMIFASSSQFHFYLLYLSTCLA